MRGLARLRSKARLLALAAIAAAMFALLPGWASAAEFGIFDVDGEVALRDGTPDSQAGKTPFLAYGYTKFNVADEPDVALNWYRPVENARTINIDLPPGFVGNPEVLDKCTSWELFGRPSVYDDPALNFSNCQVSSQVGALGLNGPQGFIPAFGSSPNDPHGLPAWFALYNLEPPHGKVAAFGANIAGFPAVMTAELRPEDYGVTITTANILQGASMLYSGLEIWGVPAASSHDHLRSGYLGANTRVGSLKEGGGLLRPSPAYAPGNPQYSYPAGIMPRPFLRNPTSCTPEGVGVETKIHAISWFGNEDRASFFTHLPAPNEDQQIGPTGCDKVPFDPSLKGRPVVDKAGEPSGFVFDLEIPQVETLNGINQADLKKAVVTLPEGVGISPSSARGLKACTDAQLRMGLKGPAKCPDASKIGRVSVETPLLAELIEGDVYIRSQNSSDPVSGEMFRVAFQLRNDDRGIHIKLPGQVRVNPQTGRVEATFDDNPQLPFSHLRMELDGGPGAPLSLPRKCGKYTTEAKLYSWARPDEAVVSKSSFEVKKGCETDSQFKPSMVAGAKSAAAGTFSQFALAFKRSDADREIKSIQQIRFPEGLLADISSVDLCDSELADAGKCTEASRIGHVQIAAGPGSRPLWVPTSGGDPTAVYLSGPYKGAPYSVSIKVPAQAGPFDLGTVVVRSALHIDERTAAISTGIDETRLIDPDGTVTQVLPGELPRLLKGVLLNQREIRVIVDRKDFMLNPTGCEKQQTSAQLASFAGDTASASYPFRARECGELGFAPKFTARILDKGRRSTLRSFHPRTQFTVIPREGDANIGGARVALPSSTILDQSNIKTTCTRAQMAARTCPEGSIVGYAKAWSPLLRKAVEGPVYLAANGGVRPLPDLAAVLDGEIRVVLQGEISTLRTGGKARLQNTFRVVPDAPVERFELTVRGGKDRGLLVNSTDLCRSKEQGVAVFTGQNGKESRTALRLVPSFKGCGKVRRQAARKLARKKAARKAAARRAQLR
jgi:hypothetical protein